MVRERERARRIRDRSGGGNERSNKFMAVRVLGHLILINVAWNECRTSSWLAQISGVILTL
jgi:hypothetical protein